MNISRATPQPGDRRNLVWVEYQGTVVNPEAKYLLLRHAFEGLGMIRVQLKTDQRNLRSQRAIEKLGAVREGVLRNHMILPDGHVRNSVLLQRDRQRMAGGQARLVEAPGV